MRKRVVGRKCWGVLGVASCRQAERIRSQFQGRTSNRWPDAKKRRNLLTLYTEKYLDYSPQVAADSEEGGLVVTSTLRRQLTQVIIRQVLQKRKQHRRRRPTRERLGELGKWTVRIGIGSKGVASGQR